MMLGMTTVETVRRFHKAGAQATLVATDFDAGEVELARLVAEDVVTGLRRG